MESLKASKLHCLHMFNLQLSLNCLCCSYPYEARNKNSGRLLIRIDTMHGPSYKEKCKINKKILSRTFCFLNTCMYLFSVNWAPNTSRMTNPPLSPPPPHVSSHPGKNLHLHAKLFILPDTTVHVYTCR